MHCVYNATKCNVTVDDKQIECFSSAGIGANHFWFVTIGEQQSERTVNGTSSYHRPRLTASHTEPRAMPLQGDGLVTVTGAHFGHPSVASHPQAGARVNVSGTNDECTVVSQGEDRIVCRVPVLVSTGQPG